MHGGRFKVSKGAPQVILELIEEPKKPLKYALSSNRDQIDADIGDGNNLQSDGMGGQYIITISAVFIWNAYV